MQYVVKRPAFAMAVSALALAWATSSNAQSTTASSNSASPAGSAQASTGSTGVADIVVTAQRREERLSQVPISVQAASGEMLARAGISDATDLPKISPALSFTGGYSPESTSLSIRGVQSVGAEGGIQPSVAVVVDGVPLARQAEFVADLADIDRVEVLAGPQGTLFGKNSTAGVVNILTKNPTDQFGMDASVEATNDKEVITKAAFNVPLADGIDTRVNGYYHYIDPLIHNLGSAGDELGQKSYGIQDKTKIRLGSAASFLVTGVYNHSYNTFGPNFIIIPNSGGLGDLQRAVFGNVFGYGNTQINQDAPSFFKTHSFALTGELNWDLADRLHLVSVSGYRNYHAHDDIDVDGGPTGYKPGIGFSPNPLGYPLNYNALGDNHIPIQYRYFSQELRLSYSAPGINIIGGGFFQTLRDTRQNNLPIIALTPDGPAVSNVYINGKLNDDTYAAFADATVNILSTVKMFGGVRYTNERLHLDYSNLTYSNPLFGPDGQQLYDPDTNTTTAQPISSVAFDVKKTYNNISGRVGIQWQPTSQLNYYASYNRGYKGPAANMGRISVGSDQALLLPETADAFEIGAKQRFWGGKIGIDLSLYYQTVYNIQRSAILPNSILTTLLNAGNLRTKGFQLDTFIEPVRGLTLHGSLVYNDATFRGNDAQGNPIRFACGPSQKPGVGDCLSSPNPNLNDTQSLVGKRATGVPKWKIVSSIDYQSDIANDLRLYSRVGVDWSSSIQWSLFEDPLTLEKPVGLVDASIGVGARDERWRLTAFVKNLTNKFYYNNLNTSDGFIGQQFGNLNRDFKRYGGLRLEMKM